MTPEHSTLTIVDGRYELTESLGVGGMSQVFRGRDLVLGRDVAVKVFGTSVDARGPEREREEMRLLAALSHPRLVTVHDAGTDVPSAGLPRAYLVMELIDGPSLAGVLSNGPLEAGLARRLGAGVAEALAYVHSRGIVHRDVKPANILLDRALQPHLADFGIAQTLGGQGLTATGLTVGTAPYLSPEQVRGGTVGPASDVYALGLVLLECLTGRREYPGTTAESALARLTRPPVIEEGLPSPWPSLLRAMTSNDPAARPPAAEVADLLAPVVDPETVALARIGPIAPPPTRALPSAPTVPARQPGRHRALLLVATAIVGSVLITLLVRSGGSQAVPPPTPAGTPGPARLAPDLAHLRGLVTP